jgi:hypothetical protein
MIDFSAIFFYLFSSVNHDGSKIEFEEINHLRTRLSEARELLALSESVKNKAEKELQKLSDENSRLKNQNEELGRRIHFLSDKKVDTAADIGLKIGSNPIVPQNTTTSTSNNVSATNHFSSVLDRLSGDIFNIVDTHIKRDAAVDDGPTPYRLDQNTAERFVCYF